MARELLYLGLTKIFEAISNVPAEKMSSLYCFVIDFTADQMKGRM